MDAVAGLKNAWIRVENWLNKNAPEAIDRLNPPASSAGIAKLEKCIQRQLPEEFKAWLELHNGDQESGPMLEQLLSTGAITDYWKMLLTMYESGEFDQHRGNVRNHLGVKSLWWTPGWIPITSDQAGNGYYLDLDPDSDGTYGQIIYFWHDHDERKITALSFSDFLNKYADRLERGEIAVALNSDGTYWCLIEHSALKGILADTEIRKINN